jgi:predicted nucleotidyltransferase
MRLTEPQRRTLAATVRRRFGAGARLWVFGSRVEDAARGGDFDILVRSEEADAQKLYDAKLAALADLHATPEFEGERIDLVLFSPTLDPEPRAVQRAALQHGVELAL